MISNELSPEVQLETRGGVFSYEEFRQIIDNFDHRLEEEGVDKLHLIPAGQKLEQAIEKQNQMVGEMEKSLLREKDRFAHIFRTEMGSLYFVLAGGESLRIRTNSDFKPDPNNFSQSRMSYAWNFGIPNSVTVKPIMGQCYFLSQRGEEKWHDLNPHNTSTGKELNQPLETSDCRVGAYPIEFDRLGTKGHVIRNRALVERQGDSIILKGNQHYEINEKTGKLEVLRESNYGVAEAHIGHKIIEVIK